MNRVTIFPSLLIVVAVAVALVSTFALARADHSTSIIGLLAIDANVQGNTATSLGPLDGCVRVEPGAQFDVDYVVDAVPEDRPIIGFEVLLGYNPDLFEVVAVDYDLMLAAVGSYQPYGGGDLTEELPDTDGTFRLVVIDLASQTGLEDPPQEEANVERGKGVLARFTLAAKAAGVGEVTIGYDPQNGGAYPLTQDSFNETIIVDKLGGASIAVGQDCPAEVVAPKILDAPNTYEEIFGGTPPPGPASPQPGVVTPATGGGDNGTVENFGASVTPTPVLVPCPGSIRATPTASSQATATATVAADTPTPASEASPAFSPAESPEPSATQITEELCTPTPTPVKDDIVDVESDSDTGLVIGAVALLGLGTAAAGGGWYMFRRSRNGVA